MLVLKILAAAFTGTLMMTIFSYLISHLCSQNFKEPELINKLISREKRISFSVNDKSFLGFVVHYIIGCLFTICFYILWEFTGIKTSLITGLFLGFIAGLAGVSGWKTLFILHESPVEIHQKKFFIQLVIAHIIFGFHVALVYLLWPVQN